MTRRQVTKGKPTGINANLAPDAFTLWSKHYLKCEADFSAPEKTFSPVPYFLLCRAIELSLKATHLRGLSQGQVRDKFGHDLYKAYEALPTQQCTLDSAELQTLKIASDIYAGKGFEYFEPEHALTGFSCYPDLTQLRAVAVKLVENAP